MTKILINGDPKTDAPQMITTVKMIISCYHCGCLFETNNAYKIRKTFKRSKTSEEYVKALCPWCGSRISFGYDYAKKKSKEAEEALDAKDSFIFGNISYYQDEEANG